MELTTIKLKIYLKGRKLPITAILSNENQLNKFFDELKSEQIIKFGDIIFKKEDLKLVNICR